ncbi:UbiA family prenyltransferase [Roseovarius sp. PS-C2]|uniref:UbiA family prenyltransferase n=1 Tax=Roseovarius sp. PS-C2 TaxID=2820814 RepID=UPI001C0C0AC3|nr:UbiA family prenyltransferase [Roseovarius sp. PS-C2]MBU3261800.1 UbiA family prenyltransferase [Roseovarius sp. PS-C2]
MAQVKVLVADLDGTLLRTDMLFETFWSSIASDWRSLFSAIGGLIKGKACLKQVLARESAVEVAHLPYNDQVIDYIRSWRAEGGQTALVTASDQVLADRIAKHLGLFDESHGSDGSHNLKGPNKAAFLVERYGENGFVYIGDSAADLHAWKHAAKAVTVDIPDALKAQVNAMNIEADHLTSCSKGIIPYLKALRPQQWLKNLLIFIPMLAAHQFGAETITQSILAFVAFCCVASGVYVLNDLLDLSADRCHPTKCNRPFASGALPIVHSVWLVPGPLVLGLSVAAYLGWWFFAVLLFYYISTLAYSMWLKRIVIIDICMLAGLYTLRILAGSAATSIPVSDWLREFSLFFFFTLATVKRQAELVECKASGKPDVAGRGYRVADLPLVSQLGSASGFVSILVLALYFNSPAVIETYSSPEILWGSAVVLLYWLTRVYMITHRGGMHDDPIIFAVKDKVSWACLVIIFLFVWVAFTF